MSDVQITHKADAARYEARVGSTTAGFAEYQLAKDLIVFTHTEVDPAYEGQGVGSALARAALDDVRGTGRRSFRCAHSSKGGSEATGSTST